MVRTCRRSSCPAPAAAKQSRLKKKAPSGAFSISASRQLWPAALGHLGDQYGHGEATSRVLLPMGSGGCRRHVFCVCKKPSVDLVGSGAHNLNEGELQ